MERRVFLEMSPVAGERPLTDEELAEVRLRAARRWPWFVLRFGFGCLVVAAVFSFAFVENPWVKGVAYVIGNLLALAGVFGAYMLWRAYCETQRLKSVDDETLVYRFTTNGYWKSYNLPTYLSPPPEMEVIYPQNLAIRSGGALWRVFRPVPLVIMEDLAEAAHGTPTRQFTDLERVEIEKHIKRYVRQLRISFLTSLLGLGLTVWLVLNYDGGIPNLDEFVVPIGTVFTMFSWRSEANFLRILRSAHVVGDAKVEWANDVSTEWLEVGELEWREGGEPARWRKATR